MDKSIVDRQTSIPSTVTFVFPKSTYAVFISRRIGILVYDIG